ncbi:hypothetical protein QJS66_22870 [Kocuria rhizophila]|nr:hypothetical protein QJS66_22870 [Kocuria rhizophila]
MKEAFVWLVKEREGDAHGQVHRSERRLLRHLRRRGVALLGFDGSGKSTTLK